MGIEVVSPMGPKKGCTMEGEMSLVMGGVTLEGSIALDGERLLGRGGEVGVAIIVPAETAAK